MIFKKEISIDGVAVIVAAVMGIASLVTISNTVVEQGKTLAEHTEQLRRVNETDARLSQSIEVLTAIVNERTGARTGPTIGAVLTPRMKDNNN